MSCIKSTVQDPKPEGKTHPPTDLKVYVMLQQMTKKVHIKSLNLFNHRLVMHVHVQLQILFWSLVLSQSLDLLRLLFHVRVVCLDQFGCSKQRWLSRRRVQGQTPLKWPPEKQSLPGRPSPGKEQLISLFAERTHAWSLYEALPSIFTIKQCFERKLVFLKLRRTPADYLITAICDHNSLLCFTLFYACLVMVKVGRMKIGTVSHLWLKLLLWNHLAGFVPSLWLIFLLRHQRRS